MRPLDYLFYWVGSIVPFQLIPDQFGNFDNAPVAEPDPWYTIVVGRRGGHESVGVESARTRRAANRALAEVEVLLAASTVDDFTGLYELGELR